MRLQLYEIEVTVDLSNNYWGTTDLDLIDEKILDRGDQSGIVTKVIFEPVLERSIPTVRRSFGSVKALFGGRK